MHAWPTGISRRSARRPPRSPPTARRARRPTPGGSCSTPTTRRWSSTGTTTCTRGSPRWIRPATPIRVTASASSSSGTGGESLDTVLPSTPNLQAWADQYYGVMKLVLQPDGYTGTTGRRWRARPLRPARRPPTATAASVAATAAPASTTSRPQHAVWGRRHAGPTPGNPHAGW